MKKLLFTFLLGLHFVLAQDIAIPYRDGNKWGICNAEGKVLIEPKFDSVEFIDEGSDTHEILIPKIKDKRGFILKGKLLFDAVYDNIYEKNGNYVLIKTDDSGKTTDYVNTEGKSLFSNSIIEIIDTKSIQGNLIVFHVLNKDLTESIFILNLKNNNLINLYENYYSLKIIDKIIELNSVPVLTKKSENDDLIIESWDFTKLPNEKVKVKIAYRSEEEYLNKFSQNSYKYRDNENGNYGGSGSVTMVEEIRGDPDHNLAIAIPEDAPTNNGKPKTIIYYKSFKKEKEKIYFIKNNYVNPNENENKEIKLKSGITDIEVKGYNYSIKNNEIVEQYNSIITYKNKGKYGFLFSENLDKTIEFDTVYKGISWKDTGDYSKEIILIVGNRDKASKKMKFNFYSNINGFVYPTFFDEITEVKAHSNLSFKKTYYTKINTKLGLISADGTQILKTEYDKINELSSASYSYRSPKMLYSTLKNNKHGLIYLNQNNQTKTIDAIFDYPIKQLIENYPKRKREYYSTDKTSVPETYITLISLKDKDGKFIGYANLNGVLYFKN